MKSPQPLAGDLHNSCLPRVHSWREPVTIICFPFFPFLNEKILAVFCPYVTITWEGSLLISLVQISGDKGAPDGEDWASLEDPGLWAGCRDWTGLRVPSLGWMDCGAGVGERDVCLERRMGWLFGDQNDWLWCRLLYFNHCYPFSSQAPC